MRPRKVHPCGASSYGDVVWRCMPPYECGHTGLRRSIPKRTYLHGQMQERTLAILMRTELHGQMQERTPTTATRTNLHGQMQERTPTIPTRTFLYGQIQERTLAIPMRTELHEHMQKRTPTTPTSTYLHEGMQKRTDRCDKGQGARSKGARTRARNPHTGRPPCANRQHKGLPSPLVRICTNRCRNVRSPCPCVRNCTKGCRNVRP